MSPLVLRIGIGKGVGLLFGAIGFVLLPYFMDPTPLLLRWGILLWYVSLGAVIGVFGVFTRHPVLALPMPWWLRAPIIGAWFNLVLAFFIFDVSAPALTVAWMGETFGAFALAIALEGAVVGFVIGFVATQVCGEGEALLQAQ